MNWIEEGLCHRSGETNNWYPDYFSADFPEKEEIAKTLCAFCPVAEECRQYAYENEPYGVWGGEDELERDLRRIDNGDRPLLFWTERRDLLRARRRNEPAVA